MHLMTKVIPKNFAEVSHNIQSGTIRHFAEGCSRSITHPGDTRSQESPIDANIFTRYLFKCERVKYQNFVMCSRSVPNKLTNTKKIPEKLSRSLRRTQNIS